MEILPHRQSQTMGLFWNKEFITDFQEKQRGLEELSDPYERKKWGVKIAEAVNQDFFAFIRLSLEASTAYGVNDVEKSDKSEVNPLGNIEVSNAHCGGIKYISISGIYDGLCAVIPNCQPSSDQENNFFQYMYVPVAEIGRVDITNPDINAN